MPEITQETPANQRMMKTVGKLKNPLLPMDKIQAKPIAQQPYSRTVSKVKTPAKTQPELAREYEMSRRARKSAPTFNEITTGIKLGINKAAQKVSGVTKVKIADKLRSTFAPNTTVKREYADPTRVGLGDWSKLGDKKIVQKLDKDGTVLKVKGDYGSYNNKTKDMKFRDNIVAEYNENFLYADNLDYLNSKNLLNIYKNVKTKSNQGNIIADKLEFDISKQTLDISMFDENLVDVKLRKQ